MSKISVLFSTNVASLIQVNNNRSIYLEPQNNTNRYNITFTKKFFINLYPVESTPFFKYLPFSCCIYYENGILNSSSNNIQIIKHSNALYEIIIMPILIKNRIDSYAKYDFSYLNEKYNAIYENNTIKIVANNNTKFYKEIILPSHNPEFTYKNNTLLLTFDVNEKKHMLFYSPKDNTSKYVVTDKIKIENNEVTLTTKFQDYAKHMNVTKYKIDNGIEELDNFTAYKKPPEKISNKNLIPYVFMQNIRAKDYKEARNYMLGEFSERLSNEHLTTFFGNFIKIIVPKITLPSNCVGLVVKDEDTYYVEYYQFFIDENNNITNIEQINQK